jgi:hypothetical protein
MKETIIANKAKKHLQHIIDTSSNEEDLLFRLAGFYGTFLQVIKPYDNQTKNQRLSKV